MVKMRLKKLRLKNFKGLKSFELNTNGGNVSIYGENATGKTTLKDSFFWLLFGKDSQGRTDFDIKTIDPTTGEAIHNLEHEVEGTLELDGKEVLLKKIYYEKWTRARGSAKKSFTGHTTDYFLEGVPVKKNKYDTRISEIARRDDIFKLLTDPGYFNEQLHWQERRKVLLEVCGNISDEDVITSDEMLTSLKDILTERSLEDHRKILQAHKKEINKELERIPVRIDEVTQGLPDVSDIQPDKIKAEIEKLTKEKKEKETELLRIQSGGEIAKETKQLREIESELIEIRNKHREQNEGEINRLKDILFDKKDKVQELLTRKDGEEYHIELNERTIKDREVEIETLRKEWHEVDSSKLSFYQSDTCPTCNQKLPEEKLKRAREKAKSNFNRDKAQRLEEITANGKKDKEEWEKLTNQNVEVGKKIKDIKKQIVSLEKEIEKIQKEIDTLKEQTIDISENEQYVKKIEEKEEIEKNIAALEEGNEEISLEVTNEIERFKDEINSLSYSLSQVEQCKKGQSRVGELKTQEKELAQEYEKLEQELYLLEEFTRTKVDLLEEKINSKFKLAKFKLFNLLVNGGIEECCETIYEGVPYGTALNNGMRKNIGIDIINTLSEHYGFTAPIWFDNREAVTELIPTKGQLISLVVSEDKKLRVEQNGGKMNE